MPLTPLASAHTAPLGRLWPSPLYLLSCLPR